jgi:chaperonin GroES
MDSRKSDGGPTPAVAPPVLHGAGEHPYGKCLRRRTQTMKVKPLNDRVLVKRLEETEKSKGGIIIPDTAKEKPTEGKVIAAGPGKLNDKGKRMPMEVKKGDRILLGKYAGNEIKIDGEEHVIVREDEILGILG